MSLDYKEIGKRITARRKQLGLKQSEVEERADLSYKYLSNIERGISIPSTEVIMRLASALEATPNEFLIGTNQSEEEEWKEISDMLRYFDKKKLSLAKKFLIWLSEQDM